MSHEVSDPDEERDGNRRASEKGDHLACARLVEREGRVRQHALSSSAEVSSERVHAEFGQ